MKEDLDTNQNIILKTTHDCREDVIYMSFKDSLDNEIHKEINIFVSNVKYRYEVNNPTEFSGVNNVILTSGYYRSNSQQNDYKYDVNVFDELFNVGLETRLASHNLVTLKNDDGKITDFDVV